MSVTVSAILAAIVAISPKVPVERAERYARDIAIASEGDAELAAALIETQRAESDFREEVETCKVTGDNGKAVTGFQLHSERWDGRGREELCASNVLAAGVAGKWLARLRRITGSWRIAFVRYIGATSDVDPHMRGRHVQFFATLRRLRGAS